MVQVRVSGGVLEGEEVDNEFGGRYCSFKGIPFAEAPIGDLRFKAPQPKKPWDGVLSAKEFGPVCPQYDGFARSPKLGSEDCLYLNVYTPELQPNSPLPVMLWIHGGGFMWGSGNDDLYGPEFLVRKGVILVTCNYRLEVLGFLCLDSEDVPGNAGMKDQVAALRWVRDNIKNFGGDPGNVTIFGESAGGASVNYLLISPMSKGLFRRAIVQSGAAAWWTQSIEPLERAKALARKLGQDISDSKQLYDYFKSVPARAFIGSQAPIFFAELKSSVCKHFAIVDEKDYGQERFFYGDLFEAQRNGLHEGVDVITGYVEEEGLITFAIANNMDQLIEKANNFLEYFVPKPLALKCPMKEQLEVGRLVKKFYFKKENVNDGNTDQLLKFISADFLVYPIMQMQKNFARNNKNKLYLYKFTCKSARNFFKTVFKVENVVGERDVVCHCDDMAYLFPLKLWPQEIDQNSKEFKMIDQVTDLWTNFAKCGNPTPEDGSVKWTPYTLATQDYLDIGEQLVPGTAPDKEEIDFWDGVFKKYLNQ